MAGMITRCPKCATAFRISDTHLKSAKGMVRCGNCLEVFDANLHLQRKAEAPPATPKPGAAGSPAKEEGKDPTMPPRQDKEPATHSAAEPVPDTDTDTDPAPTAAEDSIPASPQQAETTSSDAEETIEDDDEAWALELLKDDTDLNIQLKKIVSTDGPSKASPSSAAADVLLGQSEPMPGPEPDDEQTAPDDPLTDEALAKDFVPPKPLHEMLSAIEDPLEVAYEDPARRWRKRLLWGSLCLLGGLALLAQVAWLEFHRLGRLEPYRQAYAQACGVIGCTLPEQVDRAAIATSNLIIRSHPTRDDALVVDVILENRANFEQTFPGIVLTFTDLQSQPVATRRFEPREYLGGELAGSSHMPIAQPIHIGFEIHDPGSKAQSYHIAIVD